MAGDGPEAKDEWPAGTEQRPHGNGGSIQHKGPPVCECLRG